MNRDALDNLMAVCAAMRTRQRTIMRIALHPDDIAKYRSNSPAIVAVDPITSLGYPLDADPTLEIGKGRITWSDGSTDTRDIE